MKYRIIVDTEDRPEVDAVGLSATVVYALSTQLKSIPGIVTVIVSEVSTIEEVIPE